MKILNSFGKTVFWRVFKRDDTAYLLGWTEGTIQPGHIQDWTEDQFQQVKIEIRNGTNYMAPRLVAPGKLVNMDADLVVTSDGQLIPAEVTTANGKAVQQTRQQVQFVDLLQAVEPVERTLVFSVSKAFSSGKDIQSSFENSETWNVGAEIGGEIGKGDAKGTAKLTAGYSKTISDSLKTQYSQQVNQAWSKEATEKFTFAKGNIHAITTTWTLTVQHATAYYFGVEVPVTIIIDSQNSGLQVISKGSLAELPADLRAQYNALG
jgi:hypothetical protein